MYAGYKSQYALPVMEEEEENPNSHKRRRRRLDKEDFWTLIYDPTPVEQGGFRKGAQFTDTSVRPMFMVASFSLGSVLRNGNGKTFVVIQAENRYHKIIQRLIAYNGETI